MSAMEPLCYLMGVDPSKFSKKEKLLLEAELFIRIYEELKEFFREQSSRYFRLMKFTTEKENTVIDTTFTRLMIQDILATQEYNLEGIAYYTGTHEEVVQEVIIGRNTSPSAILLRKIIELHRSVRRDLYRAIIKKIISEFTTDLEDLEK